MSLHSQLFKSLPLTTLLFAGLAAGGIAQDTSTIVTPETKAPVILSTSPAGGEMNVDLNSVIEITFNNEMDEKSINGTTLLLHATYADSMPEMHSKVMQDDEIRDRSAINESENSTKVTTSAVSGTISYSNKVAVFTPESELKEGTLYTFTATNGVKNSENIALENDQDWSFTTMGTSDATYSDNQNDSSWSGMKKVEEKLKHASSANKTSVIDLGKAGQYVILAKKYVNNESGSKITGHIGEGTVANSPQKNEKNTRQSPKGQNLVTPLYQSERVTQDPDINIAIHDMMSAYADASLQYGEDSTSTTNKSFDSTNVMSAGVYEWRDSLNISSDVTLSGSEDDVWLFKADKNLSVLDNTKFTLADGAQADNVYWYVEGEVTIGKNAEFEGIILSMEDITLEEGAKLNGRMFSQRSITLDNNTVKQPKSLTGQTSSTNE